MKQFVLKKSGNEFDEESKKYERMNDKLNELFEKLQGDVSEEEGDAIIEQFQNLVKNCGPAYELSVSATQNIDSQANPSVVALGLVNGLTADQLGKCFENAVNAFNTTLENEFRAYQAFNKLKGEHNVN